jgi:thiol-disulfide isomerase/thioredoxin
VRSTYGIAIFCLLSLITLSGTGLTAAGTNTVEKMDQQYFEKILKTYKDKIVLVNVWATWCKPCREEFPDLLKLQESYKGKDVQIVSISADYPDEIESKILPFLEQFKLNFPIYVQDFPKQDAFINYMNKTWSGALPATFIYDKNGKQKIFFIGKKDVSAFRKEIEKVRSH